MRLDAKYKRGKGYDTITNWSSITVSKYLFLEKNTIKYNEIRENKSIN